MNSTTAVEYLLETVLGEPPNSTQQLWGPYRRAFDSVGITKIEDFLILRVSDFYDIELPEYTRVAATNDDAEHWAVIGRTLNVIERRNLEQLQLWYQDYTYTHPNTPAVRRWAQLTAASFSVWKGTYHPPAENMAQIHAQTTTVRGGGTTTTAASTTVPVSRETEELKSFLKGVKREPKDFKAFKDDLNWITWNRNWILSS
jgi:hypothetical protein